MGTFIRKYTPLAIGLLLLYAGLHKLVHPGEAAAALQAAGLGRNAARLAIIGLTSFEIYLGLVLLLRADLRYTLWAATGLFFVFTLYLLYLSTMANPPSCGCLGLTAVFKSNRHNALFGILRNCVILWLLKGALDYYSPANGSSDEGASKVASR